MRTKSIFGLFICISLVLSLSFAQPANAASAEEEVLQVVTNFAKAVSNKDFDLMSSLYWHSPKVSEFDPVAGYPFLTQGWEALETFWKDMTLTPNSSNVIYLYHPQVTMLGDNVAVTTVYQNIVSTDQTTNTQSTSQLRQTLVVQKINGKWLIVHGHASAFP